MRRKIESTKEPQSMRVLRVVLWFSPLIVLALGSLDHFLYDWTGCPFIGLWSPIGESVWEHLKIAFYPTLAVWILLYVIFRPVLCERYAAWFAGGAMAAVASALLVVLTQFFFIDTFGLPNKIFVHIPDFFIALCLSQALGAHVAFAADERKAMIFLGVLSASVTVISIIASVIIGIK